MTQQATTKADFNKSLPKQNWLESVTVHHEISPNRARKAVRHFAFEERGGAKMCYLSPRRHFIHATPVRQLAVVPCCFSPHR
jgi:hypothetical protein